MNTRIHCKNNNLIDILTMFFKNLDNLTDNSTLDLLFSDWGAGIFSPFPTTI